MIVLGRQVAAQHGVTLRIRRRLQSAFVSRVPCILCWYSQVVRVLLVAENRKVNELLGVLLIQSVLEDDARGRRLDLFQNSIFQGALRLGPPSVAGLHD